MRLAWMRRRQGSQETERSPFARTHIEGCPRGHDYAHRSVYAARKRAEEYTRESFPRTIYWLEGDPEP